MDTLLDGVEVEWKTIGEVSEIYGGLTGKSKVDFENGNAYYIPYKNIFSNIDVDFENLESVKISASENQHKVKYGDVLFTGSSEIAEEAGMSSSVTIKFDSTVYLNSFSFGVRFNDDIQLIPEFSKYLFRSRLMRTEIVKTANGVTRFNVSKARFKKILIPIPPLRVQEEIVRILDTFTELTAELAARKKQYTYYRDKLLTFEEGEVEWKALGEVTEFSNGKGHEKDIIEDGKYIVVNSKFISTDGQVAKYSNKQICPLIIDDILIVMSDLPNGKALSKTFIVDKNDKYTLNQRIGKISVKNKQVLLPKFLQYFLNRTPQLLKYNNGVDQTNLRKAQILGIQVPIPPLSEQERIVSILDKFDTLTTSITEGLPREIELRQKQYEYYRNMLLSFPKEGV
ncbi:restriction endonuclease subunit S [Enterococcus faecium]|nr:restriction endonuclease subunit S [Enterococcus faecium]TQA51140.1 restriction endonuclease subunit S [Enterococcus faecium]TQA58836.1 restriction endonuclease subunit S [Enterococcus faecium]